MGQRRVAAPLWLPTLAALLLVAAPASRPGSPALAPAQSGDRAETLGVLPFGEALVLGTVRFSVSEFRGTERSRHLPDAAELAALGGLLASGRLLALLVEAST